MPKTYAGTDIQRFENSDLLKQKVKTGPEELVQRTYDFTYKTFGNTTSDIVIEDIQGRIKNMTLRIELDKLVDSSNTDQSTGYLNWVDSIGHAIIESINFKIS